MLILEWLSSIRRAGWSNSVTSKLDYSEGEALWCVAVCMC
jgi:hypothetical protein